MTSPESGTDPYASGSTHSPYASPGSQRPKESAEPAQGSLWRQAVWWLTVPMMFFLPPWIFLGRIFLGAGGWLTITAGMVACLPLFCLLVLAGLPVLLRQWWPGSPAAGLMTSGASLVAWAGCLVVPLMFGDWGETAADAAPAPLTRWGVPEPLLVHTRTPALVVTVLALVVLLVVAWWDFFGDRPGRDGAPGPRGSGGTVEGR